MVAHTCNPSTREAEDHCIFQKEERKKERSCLCCQQLLSCRTIEVTLAKVPSAPSVPTRQWNLSSHLTDCQVTWLTSSPACRVTLSFSASVMALPQPPSHPPISPDPYILHSHDSSLVLFPVFSSFLPEAVQPNYTNNFIRHSFWSSQLSFLPEIQTRGLSA